MTTRSRTVPAWRPSGRTRDPRHRRVRLDRRPHGAGARRPGRAGGRHPPPQRRGAVLPRGARGGRAGGPRRRRIAAGDRRPARDQRDRPPRGRRARGARRDRVHAQEHRDAAQRPRRRAHLAGAALRGREQHRRLHRHARPALARGPGAPPGARAELDPGVQEGRRGDRAPGPAGHRRRAGHPAHRHDLGPARASRLAVPADPAAHLRHRARRGSGPDAAASARLRRRWRRPLLRQGLRAGDRDADARG